MGRRKLVRSWFQTYGIDKSGSSGVSPTTRCKRGRGKLDREELQARQVERVASRSPSREKVQSVTTVGFLRVDYRITITRVIIYHISCDEFSSRVRPRQGGNTQRKWRPWKKTRQDFFFIDAYLGVCTFSIVEKISFEFRPGGCVILLP